MTLMKGMERYLALMRRHDTDPHYWRLLWLNDTSERLLYFRDPLIKVSQDLVSAIVQMDTEDVMAFLVALNECAAVIATEHPEYRLGDEAAALRSIVRLSIFSCIKQVMTAITIAGLVTVLMADLDEATTVFCTNCESRLEQIRLIPPAATTIRLCPKCDFDDARWFQDSRCVDQDIRVWIQEELRGVIGDGAGA